MEKALILGDTGGIGRAVAAKLTSCGVAVTGLSRSGDGLDVTDEMAVERIIAATDGPFDLVFVATGALSIGGAGPEKTIRAISARAMMDQFALNAVGPALILKHAGALLPRKGRSVFAVLSARVGSIGDNRLGGWIGYRAAKAALNQVVHTAAIELSRSHKEAVCVALHPGTVRTGLTRKYSASHPAVPPEEAAENLLRVIGALTAAQTGGFYDWAGMEVPW